MLIGKLMISVKFTLCHSTSNLLKASSLYYTMYISGILSWLKEPLILVFSFRLGHQTEVSWLQDWVLLCWRWHWRAMWGKLTNWVFFWICCKLFTLSRGMGEWIIAMSLGGVERVLFKRVEKVRNDAWIKILKCCLGLVLYFLHISLLW